MIQELIQNKDYKVFAEIGVYLYPEYCTFIDRINQNNLDDRFILVEPLPRAIETIKPYALADARITLYPFAIDEHYRETQMYDEGASAFFIDAENAPAIANNDYGTYWRPLNSDDLVKIQTVPFFQIDTGKIDFLKVDCEGKEWLVIKNMNSRPKIIILEIHWNNFTNPNLSEILDWMHKNDYEKIGEEKADWIWKLK